MEALELLVSWVATTSLAFLVVLLDERRSTEARLERAWPPTSRAAAIVALGPLAIPFHFARTRGRFFRASEHLRWWLGLLLGFLAMTLVLVVSAAIVYAFDLASGLPTD